MCYDVETQLLGKNALSIMIPSFDIFSPLRIIFRFAEFPGWPEVQFHPQVTLILLSKRKNHHTAGLKVTTLPKLVEASICGSSLFAFATENHIPVQQQAVRLV